MQTQTIFYCIKNVMILTRFCHVALSLPQYLPFEVIECYGQTIRVCLVRERRELNSSIPVFLEWNGFIPRLLGRTESLCFLFSSLNGERSRYNAI
jgi:hypothetical protein